MSLSSILDEIQGGFSKENPGVPGEVYPEQVVEAEPVHSDGLAALEVLKDKAAKLQEHQYIVGSFKAALEGATLDKSTAMELFTMLPLANTAPAPVLTQAPTEHNKRQLLGIFNEYNDSAVVDNAVKDEVISLILASKELWEDTHHSCEIFQKDLSSHIERLEKSPPMVIHQGKSVNLLTEDICQVMGMDSFSLDYKPYEGVLDSNYRQIHNDKNFQKFLQGGDVGRANPEYVSLKDVAMHVRMLTFTEGGHHNTLHKVCGDRSQVSELDLSNALKSLDWYRKFSSVFIGSDALADKVIKLGVGFLA